MFISNPRWPDDLNQGQDLHSLRADQAMTLAERMTYMTWITWKCVIRTAAQVYVKQHIQEPKLQHAETCRALVSAKQCGKINKNHTPILSTRYCTIYLISHHVTIWGDSRKLQPHQESVGRLNGLTSRMHRCGARVESWR